MPIFLWCLTGASARQEVDVFAMPELVLLYVDTNVKIIASSVIYRIIEWFGLEGALKII